ncbi:MAG TPA: phosphoribosylanthranilate isomerase [Cyclobacteriaceae bacterium]|nr:phosphoribosylanthranilate isomerase [Cyclobacteriaceae bacterium]
MKKLKLKICGMKETKNIMDVAALSPDYMGFIFYEKSPRFVGKGFMMPGDFPSSLKKVGVFVNEHVEKIKILAGQFKFDFVQLHGNESLEQCIELKAAGHKIIKAFSIDENFDFNVAKAYAPSVDFFLFDTKGKYYGGNARPFNWEVLHRYNQEVPFFLSGGLSPDNIGSINQLRNMNIHALDLNSGIEISPGLKNIDKVNEVYDILNNI